MRISILDFIKRIQYHLTRGDERTARTKRNIIAMFVIRGLSQATGLLIVPLSLQCLHRIEYGLWLTLSSIIMWFGFLDIGLGNGLRNKLAEAIAQNNLLLARTYVSTTYAFLIIICCFLLILYVGISPYLNWAQFLNAPRELSTELSIVAFITFIAFSVRLVLGIITSILYAYQRPALNGFLDFSINLLMLIYIWILATFKKGSLITFSIGINVATIIVPFLASIYLFTRTYKPIAPTKQFINFAFGKALMNLGVRFFVLQLSYVLLYSTPNILISHFFSPEDVVPYNIAYKYYNLLSVAFAILLTPFWSAYTDAYTRKDFMWIKVTIRRLHQAWVVLGIFVVLLTLSANDFYKIWVGVTVHVPIELSLAMGFYVLTTAWSSIYANIINGTGKIQLQVYVSIIISILNIPLAYLLAVQLKWGIIGVILSPSFCIAITSFLWPIQVRKILTNTGSKLWLN